MKLCSLSAVNTPPSKSTHTYRKEKKKNMFQIKLFTSQPLFVIEIEMFIFYFFFYIFVAHDAKLSATPHQGKCSFLFLFIFRGKC